MMKFSELEPNGCVLYLIKKICFFFHYLSSSNLQDILKWIMNQKRNTVLGKINLDQSSQWVTLFYIA